MKKLAPGLYSSLISKNLKAQLQVESIQTEISKLDPAEAPTLLSGKLESILRCAFECVGEGTDIEKIEKQVNLYNNIIHEILSFDPGLSDETIDEKEPTVLEAIFREGQNQKPDLPSTSLVQSSLFTGSRGTPQLARELLVEMKSADRVDILVSFIKNSGYRILLQGFKDLCDRMVPVRIITTTYIGATDAECVEILAKYPNVQVKVSYDTKHTRLHAKAYSFYRESGFSTAYIGSSNMSDPAMSEGLEWNLKVTNQDMPHIIKAFEAEFDGYWNNPAFINYKPGVDREILVKALSQSRALVKETTINVFVDITPYPFQKRILENLEAERSIRNSFKNLIVAATGTGKTIIAVLDYLALVKKYNNRRPKLLFLAHRDEIVSQSLGTFRLALKDNDFGNQLGGGRSDPPSMDYLFCTIQTFNARELWKGLPKDFFEYIIIDEAHHVPASSYQEIFQFSPKILLGLTATPERMDGGNILEFFNNRVAAQLRLPEALEEKLLCPFQYFCISDPLDINNEKYWENGKYNTAKLENLYVDSGAQANQRLMAILIALETYTLGRLGHFKALGFCVSVRHAEFMAKEFTKKGLKSVALTSKSPEEERKNSIKALKQGDVYFVFTVDLFNEGVDIPEVNMVLFLRPTDSLTVYLQQLGRGLRHSKETGKECLLVLDFVAQMHKRYRVDRKFAALLPSTRFNIQKEVEHGFPHLPPGCTIQMEKHAMEAVLANIKAAYSNLANYLRETIPAFEKETGLSLTFANYFNYHAISPTRALSSKTWSEWKNAAGLIPPVLDADLDVLRKSLIKISKMTAPGYLDNLKCVVNNFSECSLTTAEKSMLHSLLWRGGNESNKAESWENSVERLRRNPAFLEDVHEIIDYCLENTTAHQGYFYPDIPLELHGHYGNDEIQAAFGIDTVISNTQRGVGVLHFKMKKAYALLVTINKSERDFSVTTRYKDYPTSDYLFHWESQSNTKQDSEAGKDLIFHRQRGYTIFLFVRIDKKVNGVTVPFQFLGRVEQKEYSGERPISFVWELEHPMPAELLEACQIGG